MSTFPGFKNQKGFSLVELMVVVAIIGILASIAVPSLNKYMAKARQSEVKMSLAGLYAAEKAFFAEYNTYDSRFEAVGYNPEGKLRYNVGFSAAGAQATAANGYNPTVAPAANFAAVGYCGAAGVMANGCTMLNGSDGVAPPAIPAALAEPNVGTAGVTAASTFNAVGIAVITSAGADTWAINHNKVITNTTDGIN